ncbi:MAG: RagB/SusD family nutrient uptake outer membrane protein, partial [Muribaculaceae bacterium]|nr:RagB/SusD family nutrient uptake outer membrane protein [Muribaculaceae bacterium]
YAMYTETNGKIYHLTHDSRGPLNNKQIRYSDVLLMYAEACCELGEVGAAKAALNQVRARVGLQSFPYTSIIQGVTITFADTQTDLRRAIRHERRVELAMEAHRWFDLCRWGIAKETMDAYIAGETSEARADYGTFQKGKHELFPIPSKEIDLTGITQNPGY